MLRTLCYLLTVSTIFTFLLTSCSNDSNDLQPSDGDSSWVVSTVKRVGLEINNGIEADTAWDSYTYLPGKIIHKSIYTSGYSPVIYDSLQYSYYYGSQGTLLKYENDYVSDRSAFVYDIKEMNVTYSGNNIRTIAFEDFDGNTALHQFEYSADLRTVTIYDTLNTDPNDEDQKSVYFFNSDFTIDSTLLISNYVGGIGTDTIYSKYLYSSPHNLSKHIEYDYNSFSQEFSTTITEVIQRDTRGSEIGQTLRRIRSTLDFYHGMLSESNDVLTFFDMSLPANYLFYPFPPVNLRETSNMNPALNGSVVNIFDSRNLLVEQTFPEYFGSKIEGPSKLTYTYTRIAD